MSTSKHVKTSTPTDADLTGNPLIGGGKGTTAAGITPDDLETLAGATTIEGDTANDTNAFGGIDKPGRVTAEHGGRKHGEDEVQRGLASPTGSAHKSHFGSGAQGKGTGTGAMTDISHDKIGENMVLSNRDKKQHADGRGLDSKQVQNDQLQDHAGNRSTDDPLV